MVVVFGFGERQNFGFEVWVFDLISAYFCDLIIWCLVNLYCRLVFLICCFVRLNLFWVVCFLVCVVVFRFELEYCL